MAGAGDEGVPARLEPGDLAPLLTTKLHPPPLRRSRVARPRLAERGGVDRLPALTLVSAPAGFGKTSLLAEWCAPAGGRRRVAWLSLDGADDDPAVFWRYVVASLDRAVPGTGAGALSLLRAAQPSTSVVTSLLNDLAGIDGEIALVLDDYHVIASPDVHDSVAFLLDHLPPHAHLVLGTRVDPPLPLSRLRARGDLLEVRAADLRFTTDEAAAYFNDAMGLGLSFDDVDALSGRTEGWIAAMQLAALSMEGREDVHGFVEGFAGDDRFVVDYLAEEVLERQPADVRAFLLDTAVLSRFDGALCDAVTGRRGGAETLRRLDRANLFLVALDDRREWYRYHHLFADLLRARLLHDEPERAVELHARASAWFEDVGDAPEAIAHALAGRDTERAARLVELAAPVMRRTRQEATLRRWLAALPADQFATRPVLAIALVGARMVSGDVDGVEALLDGIERWLDPGQGTPSPVVHDHDEFARLPAQVAVYRAALALIAGDPAGTIAHAERAGALTGAGDHLQRGAAAALCGLALWSTGDLDTARLRYEDAIAALTAAGHVSDVLGCSLALADIHVAQGRLRDAERCYETALRLARAHDVVRGRADMHTGLAEVLVERGELAAALDQLGESRALGEHAGLPQHAYRWRVAMARVRHAQGATDEALALLDEAERVYDTDLSPPVRPVAAVRARVHLATGDLAAAQRWAARLDLDGDALDYVREYERVTLARVMVAGGAAADAVALLERLLIAADEGRRASSAVDILVALSLAHLARGAADAASRALERALADAAPEGRVLVFADELGSLAPLLRGAGLAGPARDHAHRVLAATDAATPPRGPSRSALVEELSAREVDVLRLLRSDLSGPDIARELLVSLNTLRTHTKRIYTKLGVNSRREAVRRAGELGL